MPTGKILKIYSQDITENSADNLRKSIGAFYELKEEEADGDGSTSNQTYEFPFKYDPGIGFLPQRPIEFQDEPEYDLRGRPVTRALTAPRFRSAIEKIQVNPARIEKISELTYLPAYRIPVRLYANRDTASGDTFWNKYFMGGKFGDKIYPRLIDDETIFYDVESVLYHPYSKDEVRKINKLGGPDIPSSALTSVWSVQGNYNDYDQFVEAYQNWSTTKHELLLPNYHFAWTAAMMFATPDSMMTPGVLGMGGSPTVFGTDEAGEDLDPDGATFMSSYFSGIVGSGAGFGSGSGADIGADYVETAPDPLSKSISDLAAYYYPDLSRYWKSTGNQYFGRNFLQIDHSLEVEERAKHLQQNIIFDDNYLNYFNRHEGSPASGTAEDLHEKKASEAGIPLDPSANMMNITINFTKNESTSRSSEEDSDDFSRHFKYNFSSPQISGEDGGGATRPHRIRDMISDHNFSSKFLEALKDLDEGNLNIAFNKTRYDTQATFVDDKTARVGDKVQQLSLRTFDWFELLTDLYNNYDGAINDNFVFMGPPKISQATTYNDTTLYRFINNQNLLEVLDESVDLVHEYFENFTNIEMETLVIGTGDTLGDAIDGGYTDFSEKILQSIITPHQKPHEVLAYKIEKIGGDAIGDSSTQDLIQKFWVFNDHTRNQEISIVDTQVKYGQNYTYKGYAYVAVMSHKYKYSDFRLTKQIGIYESEEGADLIPDLEEGTQYCLQFYDPLTNNLAEQIFTVRDTGAYAGREVRAAGSVDVTLKDPVEVFEESALTRYNTFATNGQDFSLHPQLADFYFNVEPCIKIIEVPIFQKTLAVHDNPPNNISVVPFHFLDDSKKIGFDLFSDGFDKTSIYPISITQEDKEKRSSYLHSKDLSSTDPIQKFSESPARFIEIFRTTNKPTSFESFDGKLVSRIDLRIPQTEFNRKDFIAADKIQTNMKYYYVFRFVNENGMPGQLSPVLEAELHDDGGYIYSLFDIVDSSDFKVDYLTNTTTSFKRIFQLEPNMLHLMLDSSLADFKKPARSQKNRVRVGTTPADRIWDKKFKIRLTSKKTDKKLDINVTYRLREKDLSPNPSHYKFHDKGSLSIIDET